MFRISVFCRTDRFPTRNDEHTMPGLIMTDIPSEFSCRSGAHYTDSTELNPFVPTRDSHGVQTMTIPAATQAVSTSVGCFQHGAVSSALMSGPGTSRVERLRLRDWLIKMIEKDAIPGLYWLDKEKQIVKIPWKHAARHGWSRDKDACLFREWAIHTKKYDPATDSPRANPKIWKANFRCAINSLPDIEELREKGKSKGNDAYKVYRLHPKKSRRNMRDACVSKATRRQRSSSKSRASRQERRQRKKNLVICPPGNDGATKGSSQFTPTTYNPTQSSVDDVLRKRIPDILSVNVQCVINPNGLTTSSSAMTTHSPPGISSPSSVTSPTTPFPALASQNGFPYLPSPSEALTTTIQHSACTSPCSTTASTPVTTPQSPPPPYPEIMRQRHGNSWGSMGLNMAHHQDHHHFHPAYDQYSEDLSDSDCSNMTVSEVAQMVMEMHGESPDNSPRGDSPLDGNNNMEPDPSRDYLLMQKHMQTRRSFDSEFDMMNHNNRLTTDRTHSAVGYGPPHSQYIKIEPGTYDSMTSMTCPSSHSMAGHSYVLSTNVGNPSIQDQGSPYEQTSYTFHQL
ncbi:uncharacterized protein [Diadema setosum]|uniref:uncharacterized protein n=1 Tax=Diadema setosum TaxID=31175 RepID=UPI003B3B7D21